MGFSKNKKLGQLLMDAGLITEGVLENALKRQEETGLRLGQVFVNDKILTEDQVLNTLSKQLRLKRLDFPKYKANPKLKSIIPEELAQKTHVIPLATKGSLLYVASTDPTDIAALDAVERHTRMEVEPVVCNKKELEELSFAVYGTKLEEQQEIMMDMGDIDVEPDTEQESPEHTLDIMSLQSMAEDAPVVKFVNAILLQAMSKGASDVHIRGKKERMDLKMRIDGRLVDFPAPPKQMYLPLVSRVKLLSNLDISVTRVPQDGRFTYRVQNKEVSVRTSTLPTIFGEKVVMRLHVQSNKTLTLEDLGLGERDRTIIEKAITKPHGMILATGPTGSGKTTLLYALVDKIYSPDINIVTLEDPVESQMEDVTQVQLNTKAGMTFASGLRSILRQDPDVVMVGEIRDQETAHIGVQAAMTGHKVLSTLHTNDSTGTVARFLEMGLEPFLLATTLLVVVAQRLVRRLCPHCIEPYEATPEQIRTIVDNDQPHKVKMHFFRGKGCYHCNRTGFKGRMGVFEVLDITPKIQEMILRRASAYEIKEVAMASGSLRTLRMDAARKVFEGHTTFEEYLSVAQ